jgi:hypothetical protein
LNSAGKSPCPGPCCVPFEGSNGSELNRGGINLKGGNARKARDDDMC